MTKAAERLAYEAGRAAASVVWPDDATDEQRELGPHHCPFGEDAAAERAAWLTGLADALEAPLAPANVVKSLRDEIKVADRAH